MFSSAELARYLRPAGNGHRPSARGLATQLPLQRAVYRVSRDEEIPEAWLKSLHEVESASLVLIGVPSDAGAGVLRGANYGPEAIRRALLRRRSWLYRDRRVVDVGDVAVIPYLLHDEMLASAQLAECRRALYGSELPVRPVAPLSILERVVEVIRSRSSAALLILGGDHSVSWPVAKALAHPKLGIVQLDAHPDLLESSLGARFTFATWARHASALLPRGHLVQVGLRVSERSKEYWEHELGVRQYWMDDVGSLGDELAGDVIGELERRAVEDVYLSNDIDGTDAELASATGAPAADGLSPKTVKDLIAALGQRFRIVASDVVEVAPGLSRRGGEPKKTLEVAADYVEAQAAAALRGGSSGANFPDESEVIYYDSVRLWAEEQAEEQAEEREDP